MSDQDFQAALVELGGLEEACAVPNAMTHNGTFTVSFPNGSHRTFQVKTQAADARFAPGKRVLALLSGPDNCADYTGFAFVTDGVVQIWKSKRTPTFEAYAEIVRDFKAAIESGEISGVQAATKCRRCNRKLTNPASIVSGIGPECAGKGGF